MDIEVTTSHLLLRVQGIDSGALTKERRER